jgi:hypothetical protein
LASKEHDVGLAYHGGNGVHFTVNSDRGTSVSSGPVYRVERGCARSNDYAITRYTDLRARDSRDFTNRQGLASKDNVCTIPESRDSPSVDDDIGTSSGSGRLEEQVWCLGS